MTRAGLEITSTETPLNAQFQRLKESTLDTSLAARKERLLALKTMLLENSERLCDAMSQDFGYRSEFDSVMGDVLPSVSLIKYQLAHLRSWMKPRKKHSGLLLMPSTVTVRPEPKGLVGVIVPWNYPIFLSIGPLASAISAGNRVMVKLSEFTPATNAVLKDILPHALTDTIEYVEGDGEVAAQFSALAFDHLFFTGSTRVGRFVMRAASDNLTPVTLELGGKSPFVVTPSAQLEHAAGILSFAKTMNAGQICVAPDYVLVKASEKDAFITALKKAFHTAYPKGIEGKTYSSIINTSHFERLTQHLENAKAQGAKVTSLFTHAMDESTRKLAPHIIDVGSINAPYAVSAMEEELFGPVLPIITYSELDDANHFINQNDKPLALYVMGTDKAQINQVLDACQSGGAAINDALVHVMADDAPFGGIGASGMGQYHGKAGFDTFSHQRTVLKSGLFNPRAWMLKKHRNLLLWLIKRGFMR